MHKRGRLICLRVGPHVHICDRCAALVIEIMRGEGGEDRPSPPSA